MRILRQTTLVVVGCLLGICGCSSSKQESKAPSQTVASAPTSRTKDASPLEENRIEPEGKPIEPEEKAQAPATITDHGFDAVPWWEWAKPCPQDAVLKGSPDAGDVRCELSEGQIHGRRTQWEPEERTRYYSKGKLLTKRAPPKKKKCSTDEAHREKLTGLGARLSADFCITRPSSFEGVLLDGKKHDDVCQTNVVATVLDCKAYKTPPVDRILARAGWRSAPLEIRRQMAEDLVHQILTRNRKLASNKGEYVRSRTVGNKIVVGLWTLIPIGHGRVNLNENEYTFGAEGSYPSYSQGSVKEISENEIALPQD